VRGYIEDRLKRGRQKNNGSLLDLRDTRAEVVEPKPIILTKGVWESLKKNCRQINDDQFTVRHVSNEAISFELLNKEGKPDIYRILAKKLKHTSKLVGKKLYATFLTFIDDDGQAVVVSDKDWFDSFKPWIKYWAGKGVKPVRPN